MLSFAPYFSDEGTSQKDRCEDRFPDSSGEDDLDLHLSLFTIVFWKPLLLLLLLLPLLQIMDCRRLGWQADMFEMPFKIVLIMMLKLPRTLSSPTAVAARRRTPMLILLRLRSFQVQEFGRFI